MPRRAFFPFHYVPDVWRVYIHGVKNADGQVAQKGANPLAQMGVNGRRDISGGMERGQMGKVRRLHFRGAPGHLWFDAPTDANVIQLSDHCMSYDFTQQNGRNNIGGWIETAAGLAGR
jgi:hypothetical protein